METKKNVAISVQAFKRMPTYLEYLKKAKNDGAEVIAATTLGGALKLNEVQVRKDLAAICTTKGKPKSGFLIDELIANMEEFLGYNNVIDAVVVGAGSLGTALLSYHGFESCGFNLVAAFDSNKSVINKTINGKMVLNVDKLSDMCRRLNINIGIITVPASQAQVVCDQLVAGGVKAIWNFAATHLSVPDDVIVQNENIVTSLILLSKQLEKRLSD